MPTDTDILDSMETSCGAMMFSRLEDRTVELMRCMGNGVCKFTGATIREVWTQVMRDEAATKQLAKQREAQEQ